MDTKVEQSECPSLDVAAAQAATFCVELSRGLTGDERISLSWFVDYTNSETMDLQPRPFNAENVSSSQRKTVFHTESHSGEFNHFDYRNVYPSYNVFAPISGAKKTMEPDKHGRMRPKWRRRKEHLAAGLALMIDDVRGDDVAGLGSKGNLTVSTLAAILPPTCVVCTSPGNYQVWYFLDAPERDTAKFINFLVSFVDQKLGTDDEDRTKDSKRLGGGDALDDPVRVGRVPFGVNTKSKYLEAYGRVPPVWLVSADYTKRYSIDTICAAFGVTIRVPAVRAARARVPDDDVFDRAVFDSAVEAYAAAGQLRRSSTDGKYRIRCPWEHEHSSTDGDSAFIANPDAGMENAYVFGCAHTTCKEAKRTWAAFVAAFLIEREEAVADELEAVNASACVGVEALLWVGRLCGLKAMRASAAKQAAKRAVMEVSAQ